MVLGQWLSLCALALAAASGSDVPDSHSWALIIDAGSSGTRLQLYHWSPITVSGAQAVLEQYTPSLDSDLLKVSPGISNYSSDPTGVAPGITQLVEQGMRWVPENKHADTPIYIFATAGMRLLESTEEAAIWDEIRALLANSTLCPFSFDSPTTQAKTITGAAEGAFGWLTVNYVTGLLSSSVAGSSAGASIEPVDTLGAMDLGGPSTQITFYSTVDLMSDSYPISYATHYLDTLFAQTHMRAGQDQAILRLFYALFIAQGNSSIIKSPCHRSGWTSDPQDISSYGGPSSILVQGDYTRFNDCSSALVEYLLHTDYECTQKPCSIQGRYQPALPAANAKFYAFSGFWYAIQAVFKLSDEQSWNGTLAELGAASDVWCAINGSGDSGYDSNYCFASSYTYALLVEGYGIPADEAGVVESASTLSGYDVGWTLGAALHVIDELQYEVILHNEETCEASRSTEHLPSWVWPVLITLALVALAQAVFVAVMMRRRSLSLRGNTQSGPEHIYHEFESGA